MRMGMDINEIHEITRIDKWFLYNLKQIIELEEDIKDQHKSRNLPTTSVDAASTNVGDLHVRHFPSLVGEHLLHDFSALAGVVLHILDHDVHLVEPVALLDLPREGDELVRHHSHVAGDPEAVFILVVIPLHLLVRPDVQDSRRQDADLPCTCSRRSSPREPPQERTGPPTMKSAFFSE